MRRLLQQWLRQLCLVELPAFPVLYTTQRQAIADESAGFIIRQIDLQPLWMRMPLYILTGGMGLWCRFLGNLPQVMEKLPGVSLGLRFVRAMTNIVFHENDVVRQHLGQNPVSLHIDLHRQKRKVKFEDVK